MIQENDSAINSQAISYIAKNYNTLDYQINLIALLNTVFPKKDFTYFSKYELHKTLNDALVKNYRGEEILKFKLFEQNLSKQNVIGAFEMKVNNSRVDFLTINGCTTSYEIKSELDNLSKLKKQMSDYLLAFEFNYLVIGEGHMERAQELLPNGFGLWLFKNGKYRKLKKAEKNREIDPEVQLSLLTKRELATFFLPGDSIKGVLRRYNASIINSIFKKALKERYKNRWKFITSNHDFILPIDLQFFFKTNVKPTSIYWN